MTKLDDNTVQSALSKLPGWTRAGDAIEKAYRFKNYYETMAFVNAIAWLSHQSNHHPDLTVGYNRCTVRYSTHDAGGITQKDLDSARNVESLGTPS